VQPLRLAENTYPGNVKTLDFVTVVTASGKEIMDNIIMMQAQSQVGKFTATLLPGRIRFSAIPKRPWLWGRGPARARWFQGKYVGGHWLNKISPEKHSFPSVLWCNAQFRTSSEKKTHGKQVEASKAGRADPTSRDPNGAVGILNHHFFFKSIIAKCFFLILSPHSFLQKNNLLLSMTTC
jgi:hypothetical protein